MEKKNDFNQKIFKLLSYLLVAVLASCVTCVALSGDLSPTKLEQLEALILERFVGDADQTKLQDAAAQAMVAATGDKWSYYIPADQYAAHMEQMQNAYVGIGVTMNSKPGEQGYEIQQVDPSGGAYEAGILPGDIMVAVEQQSLLEIGIDAASTLIRGKEDSQVEITVLRDGQTLTFSVTRRLIQVTVAEGQMLEGNIGLVRIDNFDERCAEETLAVIEDLLQQDAKALIFDVRFNPGGYKTELTQVLDYLLPEGTIFHSQTYDGQESKTESDEKCLELPMAVLINGYSYSAAEFFAAALDEYDWAVVIGEPTTGKSYFQNTYQLSDGSAVGLSIGKYFTPNGVSLAEVGGLKPEVEIKLDDETAAKVYAGTLEPAEDPHIQAAIEALQAELG